jgi:DNA-binding transcriptional ArsR family regulator
MFFWTEAFRFNKGFRGNLCLWSVLLKQKLKQVDVAGTNPQAAAFLAKTMADENRLRIIYLLADGKKPVSRIVEELGISQPLASHHLKELKRSLLVTVERRGPFVYYELADQRIVEILRSLHLLAEDLLTNRTTF